MIAECRTNCGMFYFVFVLSVSLKHFGSGFGKRTVNTHSHNVCSFFPITHLLSTVSLKSGRRGIEGTIGWFICPSVTMAGTSLTFSPSFSNSLPLGSTPIPSPPAHPKRCSTPYPCWFLPLVLARCTRGAPACPHPGSSSMDPLSDPPASLSLSLSLFLSLSFSCSLQNKIIRATAVTDQLQLIIQERTSLNQYVVQCKTWCGIIGVTCCSCRDEGGRHVRLASCSGGHLWCLCYCSLVRHMYAEYNGTDCSYISNSVFIDVCRLPWGSWDIN